MFDGMFNISESFTQDFLAPPSPPQSQQSEDPVGRLSGERVLGKGILHSTIATLRNLARQKAFEESDIKALGSEWSHAIIVGWITELDTTEEGVLSGQMCDGTAAIDFRYELASGMPDAYQSRLKRLRPIKYKEPAEGASINMDEAKTADSHQPEYQVPAKMVGNPTLMNDEVLFVASHCKAATYDEVISSHFLECGLVCLRASTDHPEHELHPVVKEGGARLSEPLGVDPYYGEEVTIPEEIGVFMEGPSNRIKRVIWRFLDEASRKEFNTDKSESCVAVRAFCGKMWKDREIDAALDALDEDGILFYMDASKERVALV